ncbi:hypothetical protein FOMPIDRAFT_1090285, partial [Fomitopsis schrenkii]
MLRTAKKYHVSFAAIKLSKRSKSKLPIWYHLGATKKLRSMNNSPAGKCLRELHGVRVVADLLPLRGRACILRAGGPTPPTVDPGCECGGCTGDRALGCKNPQRCAVYAAKLLDEVRPKWHPDRAPPNDGLSLTTRRK